MTDHRNDSSRKIRFSIRSLLCLIFLCSLLFSYLASRSEYVILLPKQDLLYQLLMRGDKIDVWAVEGDQRDLIKRGVQITKHQTNRQNSRLTIPVTPEEWRSIFWADITGKLTVKLRGEW